MVWVPGRTAFSGSRPRGPVSVETSPVGGLSNIADIDETLNTVREDDVNGASVGITLFATDATPGDTVTYSLPNSAGGRFTVDGTTGVVTLASESAIDFAINTFHDIDGRATSSDGTTSEQVFRISVIEVPPVGGNADPVSTLGFYLGPRGYQGIAGDTAGERHEWNEANFLGRFLEHTLVINMGRETWSQVLNWDGAGQYGTGTTFQINGPCRIMFNVVMNTRETHDSSSAATLATAAGFQGIIDGDRDAHFQNVAQKMIDAGLGNAVISLANEYEQGLGSDSFHNPWHAHNYNSATTAQTQARVDKFKAAWAHVHGVMMGVTGADFKFAYIASNGSGMTGEELLGEWVFKTCYPGDAYVDIIGGNIYDKTWLSLSEAQIALDRVRTFCVERGKQVGIREWGLWTTADGKGKGDNPDFIQLMFDFFAGLPATGGGSLFSHNYFDGHFEVNLQNNDFPLGRQRFDELFGDA